MRKRRKRAPVAIERLPLQIPPGPNHTWSMDFVFDALATGKPIKCLTVVDDYTKESVEIAVARRVNGQSQTCSTPHAASAAIPPSSAPIRVRSSRGARSTNGLTPAGQITNPVDV